MKPPHRTPFHSFSFPVQWVCFQLAIRADVCLSRGLIYFNRSILSSILRINVNNPRETFNTVQSWTITRSIERVNYPTIVSPVIYGLHYFIESCRQRSSFCSVVELIFVIVYREGQSAIHIKNSGWMLKFSVLWFLGDKPAGDDIICGDEEEPEIKGIPIGLLQLIVVIYTHPKLRTEL